MAEWARVLATTISEYVRGEEVNVLRSRKLTALLMDRGRISYNHGGEKLDWKFRYKRAPLIGFADADTLTFPRRNRWKTATLPWRGYAVTDSYTKKEKLMNKGKEAIIRIVENTAKILMEDMEENFGEQFYVDGESAGNTKGIHGIESFLGDAGNTINITTGAERSANAADLVAAPNQTYAGQSTQLGALGGSWTGSFPSGTASTDQSFDSWSPLLVNWSSDAWVASSDTFSVTGKEAVRYLLTHSHRNKSKKGQMDLVLLERDLYNDFKNLLDDKERFHAQPGDTQGSLAKFGFTDYIWFDGAQICSEYGIPDNVGYGLNLDMMELKSLQGQLFVMETDMDHASKSNRFSIDFFGNLQANPRFQGKLENYAT